jgi:hypothetical protein
MVPSYYCTRGVVPLLPLSRRCKSWSILFYTFPVLRRGLSVDHDRLPLTTLELEQTEAILRKGFQVWEISLHLGRSESVVQSILKDDEGLASLLRMVTKGRWTATEDEALLRLLVRRGVPDRGMIAQRMGRTVNSVACRIRKLAKAGDSSMSPSLPTTSVDSNLSESEGTTLRARLDGILEGLMKTNKRNNGTVSSWRLRGRNGLNGFWR